MENQQPQHSATPESAATTPKSARAPRGANRCRRRSRAHGRCRLPVHDPATGLCFRHAAPVRKTTYALSAAPDRDDLSADLFGPTPPTFDSPEEINRTLANLVTLVAQGRISTRRASVITYALSFILRGLQVIDQKALEDAPAGIILDVDSAVARHALAAQMQTPASNAGSHFPSAPTSNSASATNDPSHTRAPSLGPTYDFYSRPKT